MNLKKNREGDDKMLGETIHIAVPTAFFKDETIDIDGTIIHIKNLYKQGVKSVLVSGTTGEQHSLSLKEKLEIIKRLEQEEELLMNMEVIFGVASIRQKEAEELAKRIGDTKIAGMMLGYPPYVLPSQEEAFLYTKKIINLCNKPTILYNNPKRTGFDLSTENIIQLSNLDLVVGIKDAGNKEKVDAIKVNLHRKNFYFYAGGEMNLKEKVSYGYNRLSSIASNINPLEIEQWFLQMLKGQTVSNQEKELIDKIMKQVYDGNPIVNLKKAMNDNKIRIGICRSPIGNSN